MAANGCIAAVSPVCNNIRHLATRRRILVWPPDLTSARSSLSGVYCFDRWRHYHVYFPYKLWVLKSFDIEEHWFFSKLISPVVGIHDTFSVEAA